MKQQEAGSIVFSQLTQRQLQFLRQIEFPQSRRWCGRFDNRFNRTRPRLPSRLMSPTAVDRDHQDPRLERSHAVPVVQVTNRSHERFLSHVLRILPLAELAQADRKDQPLKQLDESPQPVPVACKAAFDECPFIHRTVHLSGE